MLPCHARSRFTFFGDDGTETTFVAAEHAGRIAALSAHLETRLKPETRVGLLYRSEPNLLIGWFACIMADLKPLIMQYPTRKQTRTYWAESVTDTINRAGIRAIIADDHCCGLMGDSVGTALVVSQQETERVAGLAGAKGGSIELPKTFSILQLSSGTTGFRKAIEFTSDQLARHVEDYNTALALAPGDRIASWLPLYHDMGYIACFVMPMLLGIDVVMMDPMTWVRNPVWLFDLIEQHAATVCYMPNFGFEVMARASPRKLPSMRRWISCSEPVSQTTSKKFLAAVGADPLTFTPCYAMAENVFAVSLGSGCSTRRIDGADVVSCGKTIAGVNAKTVEGEIWVRSPTSIARYIDGPDIRDAEGFYPTGDLGEIADGELFVAGRKQDLLIQAGRKFLLSDIDLRLNEAFPDIRGRAATLAVRSPRVGTEVPLVLIESPDFFARTDNQAIATKLAEMTGLDQIQVAHVPPRFLTKTSSGKVNRRKTRADWEAVQTARAEGGRASRDPRAELRASFANADWDSPAREALDSLSRTILQAILDGSGIVLGDAAKIEAMTLAEIDEALRDEKHPQAPRVAVEGIRIVSLADKRTLGALSEQHLDRLEQSFGCPVTFEHVCLPPSPVILSDLIFHEYFRPRLDAGDFTAVDDAMEKIRGASMLIVDDIAEWVFLYESVYPVISHNLERDPRSDLISFRWQQYTRNHDRLPLSVIGGIDIPLSASAETLGQLERYLGTPIFRIATVPAFDGLTRQWEYRPLGGFTSDADTEGLVSRLSEWHRTAGEPLRRKRLPAGPHLSMSDLGHFCSHMVSKDYVDRVLHHFDRFCVAGERSSVPYIRRALDGMGKPYATVPSHAPQMLAHLHDPYDCLLLCGPVGDFPTQVPVVALQHADTAWRTRNMDGFAATLPHMQDMPVSSEDWFHSFALHRSRDYDTWSAARVDIARATKHAAAATAAAPADTPPAA